MCTAQASLILYFWRIWSCARKAQEVFMFFGGNGEPQGILNGRSSGDPDLHSDSTSYPRVKSVLTASLLCWTRRPPNAMTQTEAISVERREAGAGRARMPEYKQGVAPNFSIVGSEFNNQQQRRYPVKNTTQII